MAGDILVIALPDEKPTPCSPNSLPAISSIYVKKTIYGHIPAGIIDVLILPGSSYPPPTESLMLLVPVKPGEGSACPRLPFFRMHIIHSADNPSEKAHVWKRYTDAIISLPPGGNALEKAMMDLWVNTLASEEPALRKHASLSLKKNLRISQHSFDAARKISTLLLDEEADPRTRLEASSVMAFILDPSFSYENAFDEHKLLFNEAGTSLMMLLDDPNPALRKAAVKSLAPLAEAKNSLILERFHQMRMMEKNNNVLEELDNALPEIIAETVIDGKIDHEAEKRLGQRMLLVFLGLMALLGMALIPYFQGHIL